MIDASREAESQEGAVSIIAIIAIVWAVGCLPSAYLLARVTGDMAKGGYFPIWPIALPLLVAARLSKLGEEHSK